MNQSRRRLLRVGTGAFATGLTAGCQGLTLPENPNAAATEAASPSSNFYHWLPAPGELGVQRPYPVTVLRPELLAPYLDRLPAESASAFRRTVRALRFDGVEFARLDRCTSTPWFSICEGDVDREILRGQLSGGGFDEVSTRADVTVYDATDADVSVGLGPKNLVTATSRDGTSAAEVVRSVVDAATGSATRYVAANPTFEHLVEVCPAWPNMRLGPHRKRSASSPATGVFRGVTGWAVSQRLGTERTRTIWTFVTDENGRIDRAAVERWANNRLFEETNVRVGRNAVTVSATLPLRYLRPYDAPLDVSSVRGMSETATDGRQRLLTIEGGSRTERAYYQFVAPRIDHAEEGGASVGAEDVVLDPDGPGQVAYGFVAGGVDSYRITGDVRQFNITDMGADVTLGDIHGSGRQWLSRPKPMTDPKHTIALSHYGGNPVDYQFRATGAVGHAGAPSTIDPEDLVLVTDYPPEPRSTAYGKVSGGFDVYGFSGEITAFDVGDERVGVTIDGRRVATDELRTDFAPGPNLTNSVVVRGGSSDSPLRYQFRTSGAVNRARLGGATIDPGDFVWDRTVYGYTAGGADGYTFDGRIEAFRTNDVDATVTVNGTEVRDPVGQPAGTDTRSPVPTGSPEPTTSPQSTESSE